MELFLIPLVWFQCLIVCLLEIKTGHMNHLAKCVLVFWYMASEEGVCE